METKVYVDNIQFMRIEEKELVNKIKKAFPLDNVFTDGELYICPEKALCFL